MVDIARTRGSAQAFAADVLDAAHVLIRGDSSDTHVRISIGTPKENNRLVEGVERLLAAPH